MSRISGWVSKHPIATAVGLACAAGGIWLAAEIMSGDAQVFRQEEEEDDDGASVESSTGNKAEAVAAVAEAVKRADVYNRFTRRQLLALYAEWKRDLKTTGSDSLTLVQFAKVFNAMGVKDDLVIRSLFEAWDTDKDGTVDFSELLNAIAITAGGSLEDKLSLCFRAFDLNGDGCVSPEELRHFFTATREALGKEVEATDIERRVAAVFTLCDANHDGHITEEEFREAAMQHNFFKPGGLFEDFENAMKMFLAR